MASSQPSADHIVSNQYFRGRPTDIITTFPGEGYGLISQLNHTVQAASVAKFCTLYGHREKIKSIYEASTDSQAEVRRQYIAISALCQ